MMHPRRWIYVSVGLLGVNALAVGTLVTASARSAPLVVPQYYERAVAWDQAMVEARRAAELGWRLELSLGAGAVTLTVRDPDGQPVPGVRVIAQGVHRGQREHRLELDLTTDADGRASAPADRLASSPEAPAAATIPGWYQLELTVSRGEVRYRERRALLLREPRAPGQP